MATIDVIVFVALWYFFGILPAIVLTAFLIFVGMCIPGKKSTSERLAFPLL